MFRRLVMTAIKSQVFLFLLLNCRTLPFFCHFRGTLLLVVDIGVGRGHQML